MSKTNYTPELKVIKALSSVGGLIWVLGWIAWLIETLIFTIVDGWHTSANRSPLEARWDNIVSVIMFVGAIGILTAMYRTQRLMIKLIEE